MTFLVKHTKTESGIGTLLFKNGRHTIYFTLSDSGIAFDIYKGKDINNGREAQHLAGFNLVGQRMSGPYDHIVKEKLALANFELNGKAKRYVYVEGDVPGIPNRPIFTVDKEPFDHITFCDSEGLQAIDIELDKEGRITSVCRSHEAITRDDLIVMFEDERNPKLNKLIDLNRTGHYHFLNENKTTGLKEKIAAELAPKVTRGERTSR